ncbi:hypothetical protein O3P69_006427 [Scylla paramamosain]|uniref:Uncharacterized protein n=1 Tax=Scylla paramamosain TaxID=85552 RepID=A0AAW0U2F3_SCYPA
MLGAVKLKADPRRPVQGSSADSAGRAPKRVTSSKTAQRRPPPHSPNLESKEGMEQELSVYVANTDDLCLLGLDYLLENCACLDFGKMHMEVQGKEVLLLKANASAQVVAAKTTSVPPRMETWSGLLVRKTLVQPDDEITRESRCQPKIVHIDLLWRYYGPEQYMWGSGDGDDEDEEESSHEELQEDEEDAAAGTGGDDEKDEMRRQTQLGQRSNLYCRSPS